MLGKVITHVGVTRSPTHIKLSLFHSVLYPVKAHVHGFGTFLLDIFVDDSICCGAICFQICCLLWMVHFCQRCTGDNVCFGVNKYSSKLGLSHGGNHMF
jgi:hypothetical protein